MILLKLLSVPALINQWFIFLKVAADLLRGPSHILLNEGIGGGGRVKFKIFLVIAHVISTDYQVSKMGSFVSQLATTAKIWRNEGGSYAHIFGYIL